MDLTTAAAQAQGGKNFFCSVYQTGYLYRCCFSIATVVKVDSTSFAAGLTGGVALQAASMAGMFSGIGHTAAAFVGGSMLGYGAARGNEEIREEQKHSWRKRIKSNRCFCSILIRLHVRGWYELFAGKRRCSG